MGKDELVLEGFSGEEAVSRPFRFSLDLLSKDSSIDPGDILRKPLTVSIKLADGTERVIHGISCRFVQLGRTEELTNYRAEIVPWFWFLNLSNDCRIFQKKTVLEIIESALGEYGDLQYDVRCVGSYEPREYCVQYRETDFDFVSRLMEQEGIFYFFEHTASGHTLVLADDSSSIPECAQKDVKYSGHPGGWVEEDVISSVVREHSVYTTSVTLTDYDYLQPSVDLLSSAVETSTDEAYDYPGKFSETQAGEHYANLRLEALAAQGEVLKGTSVCRTFQAGHQFVFTDYFPSDLGCFLLSIKHSASGGGYRAGRGEADYSNEFTCMPIDTPYRPPVHTAKPAVHGTQTAVVVGPAGEEVYTDEHGRIKVQFHWDRKGAKDENSSCWVRVATPWGGKGYGSVSIPRIGNEVVIGFIEGDPDRPLVMSSVYNAEQKPPFDLPGAGIQMGMKSRSSPGGGGDNEITMTDTKGKESMNIHAQYNQATSVGNDQTRSVANNRTTDVGVDDTETVGSNQSITVGADQSTSVGANQKNTVGADQTVDVGGSQTTTVGGDQSTTVGGATSHTTGSSLEVTSGSDTSLTVGANATVNVGANSTVNAGGNIDVSAGANLTIQAGANITLDGVMITIQGKGKVAITCGGSSVTVDPSGVTVMGPMVKLN